MSDGPFAAQKVGRDVTDAHGRTASGLRWALSPAVALVLWGCAAVTPAPRFSAQSPADPAVAEAATPPATPVLMTGADEDPAAPERPAPSKMEMDPNMEMEPDQGQAMDMHKGHVMASPVPSPTTRTSEPEYTCPMHPEVKKDKPGACPICGMTLVKKAAKRKEQHP